MFAFAYLLFTNIAMMAGMLFALATESRRRDDQLTGARFNPRHRQASEPMFGSRRAPETTHPR